MKDKTITPRVRQKTFTCPHCHAISSQLWNELVQGNCISYKLLDTSYMLRGTQDRNKLEYGIEWLVSECENCSKVCLWHNGEMVYPSTCVVEAPNSDLPEDIQKDYTEAASILNQSPRGAAALLRLCVQKLCIHLGKKGKNLDNDIAELVKDGLSDKVVKAMDVLRVTGNNAVHPGEIEMSDNIEVATKLFSLLNFIAEKMISEPKEIDTFYNDIVPESAKNAIKKRNKGK